MFNKKTIPVWMGMVLAIGAMVYTLAIGGVTTQIISAGNGAEYEITLDMLKGIVSLVDECKLTVGESCTVEVSVIAKMIKAPDVAVEIPTTVLEAISEKEVLAVSEGVKVVADPVKPNSVADKLSVKIEAKPVEAKPVEAKPVVKETDGEGK